MFWGVLSALLEWLFCRRCWGHCSPWSTASESWLLPSPAVLTLGTVLQSNPAPSWPLLRLSSLGRETPLLSEGLSATLASCTWQHTTGLSFQIQEVDRALLPHPCSAGEWKNSGRLSEVFRACPQVWDVARLQFSFSSAAYLAGFSLNVPSVFDLNIFASSKVFWKEMLHHYQWELSSSLVSWFHCPTKLTEAKWSCLVILISFFFFILFLIFLTFSFPQSDLSSFLVAMDL